MVPTCAVWFVAMIGFNQLALATGCAFVRMKTTVIKAQLKETQLLLETECFRHCYLSQSCDYVVIFPTDIDGKVSCHVYSTEGKGSEWTPIYPYKLLRNEVQLKCKRQVVFDIPSI
ncbi:hypothetical protein RB195_008449 [Necator americanus]|uniref:Apple domain-containing protein n=1 Tax=Necator americanus TaxID=51031 RepID=A0ABR1CQL8_NECAM